MNSFKQKASINNLRNILNTYMPKDKVDIVYKAYTVAADAHKGQYRRSGEAYVFHPISVAIILAELQLNHSCIIAALLHDCIEDTLFTKKKIIANFGKEIAHIVEGVSKFTGLELHSKIEKQAQNFRKLLLAMSLDMRVIIIKLADRLHNMRTLKHMSRDKQLRIARETIEIHAPIARRLGLYSIRIDLDDLCFETLYPYRNKVLQYQIKRQFGERKKIVNNIEAELNHRLRQEGFKKINVSGRKKQPCNIYKKMKNRQLKFSQVLDVYAFRVIVSDILECYQALGIIHNLYKPVPGKFKDYIALPKSNGYQSLHTVLFGPSKLLIEVQIRSHEMHFIAEYGIAAHWHYKSNSSNTSQLANNWLGSLLDIQQSSGTSIEFLEQTKVDLFPSEVFVFTPEGDIIQLPYKANVLDFAYAVHTNVGNHTIKAKIDKINIPISTELKSGQTIEIITDKQSKPNPSWLEIVTTTKARTSIKAYLKEKSKSKLIKLGKKLLADTFDYQDLDVKKISKSKWQHCLSDLKCNSKDELYMKIGLSEVLTTVVHNKLEYGDNFKFIKSMKIKQIRGKAISFAHCCYPIPDDKMIGVLTISKGLVLHKFDCGNLIHAKQKNAQYSEINWQVVEDEEFQVLIKVKIKNRRGTLASIANLIAKIGINIESLEIEEKELSVQILSFVISVPNVDRLNEAFIKIKKLDFVQSAKRG